MERELWKILSAMIARLDRRYRRKGRTHSVGRVVRVYLWAVLHDRPVSWACQKRHWIGVKPPARLPHQSCMSRRLVMGDTRRMLDEVGRALHPEARESLLRYLDGKPLVISRHSIDPDARHGRGAGGRDKGYKLHAIFSGDNQPIAWCVRPLNESEHRVAVDPVGPGLTPGYLLADGGYDVNHLHEHAGRRGVKLLTNRRNAGAKGKGHHPHSEHRLDVIDRLDSPSVFVPQMLKLRRRIETRFAHLTNYGGGLTCLPPWVRRLHRVTNWVAGKIIIRIARDHQMRNAAA